jgi:hypothetical protein
MDNSEGLITSVKLRCPKVNVNVTLYERAALLLDVRTQLNSCIRKNTSNLGAKTKRAGVSTSMPDIRLANIDTCTVHV